MRLVPVLFAALLLPAAPAAGQTVTIKSRDNGMFHVDLTLNDQVKVRGLIDTGATFLSMCGSIASPLGLKLGDAITLTTANGRVQARATIVGSVRIGTIEVRDIAASVDTRPECDKPLLVGMAVLRHLHMHLDGTTLELSARKTEPRSWHPPQLWPLALLWSVLAASCLTLLRKRRSARKPHALGNGPTATASFMVRSLFD